MIKMIYLNNHLKLFIFGAGMLFGYNIYG